MVGSSKLNKQLNPQQYAHNLTYSKSGVTLQIANNDIYAESSSYCGD